MNTAKRFVLIFIVLVSCVSCDQTTKTLAQSFLSEREVWSFLGDTVRLQLAHNHGAFLGLGASLPTDWREGLFSVGVGGMLLFLLGLALFSKSTSSLVLLAFALMFAGGVGNLMDRLMYNGYVVDFINIGVGSLRTGIFNVADIAVTAGVFMLIADMLNEKNKVF
ncbi:MAG: signal peptidase II [Methylobacter sp.]|jgi:signal peptidase II